MLYMPRKWFTRWKGCREERNSGWIPKSCHQISHWSSLGWNRFAGMYCHYLVSLLQVITCKFFSWLWYTLICSSSSSWFPVAHASFKAITTRWPNSLRHSFLNIEYLQPTHRQNRSNSTDVPVNITVILNGFCTGLSSMICYVWCLTSSASWRLRPFVDSLLWYLKSVGRLDC